MMNQNCVRGFVDSTKITLTQSKHIPKLELILYYDVNYPPFRRRVCLQSLNPTAIERFKDLPPGTGVSVLFSVNSFLNFSNRWHVDLVIEDLKIFSQPKPQSNETF